MADHLPYTEARVRALIAVGLSPAATAEHLATADALFAAVVGSPVDPAADQAGDLAVHLGIRHDLAEFWWVVTAPVDDELVEALWSVAAELDTAAEEIAWGHTAFAGADAPTRAGAWIRVSVHGTLGGWVGCRGQDDIVGGSFGALNPNRIVSQGAVHADSDRHLDSLAKVLSDVGLGAPPAVLVGLLPPGEWTGDVTSFLTADGAARIALRHVAPDDGEAVRTMLAVGGDADRLAFVEGAVHADSPCAIEYEITGDGVAIVNWYAVASR